MKKIISLILCLLMLLSSVCTTAFAEGEYEFFEKRQAIASYNADAPADLVIPSEINGLVVETILDSAFTSEAAAVEKLTLPEGLMFISDRNFNKSPALATVTLPETLQVVGENVFRESAALTEITIPAAVTMIGKSSFAKNENLKSVTFTGMAPLYVGEYAFGSNHAEMVIYVPDDQIDAYIAVLPEGLNIQPSGANAVVVDYTASEDLFTFDAATGTITATTNRAPRVDIPATIGGVPVTAIGAGVFKESNYVCCIIVPEGVTTIGDEAFASCSFLDYVDLPDSVTAIGAKAFNGYQGLSLEMPAQLQTIGEKAFAYSNIDSIILPEGVTEIPTSAFESAKFSSLTLPGNLITIGNNAFYKCKYYKEVTVPGSVTSIGSGAFAESDRLEKIILECDPSVLPADAISGEKVTVEHVGAAPVEESTVETTVSSEGGIAGTWNAVSAEVDGETMDKAMLEMFGLLITLNFNEDGTGTLAMEGEAGDITWTEDAGVVSIFVEGDSTTLNMNDDGTLSGDFGGVIIAFAKGDGEVAVGGETPVEVPADVDTSALLGTWFDGDATNFTIYADGTCVATDQYGDSWMDWEVVDGVPMITTGMWSSAPLVLNADGTLYVNDGMIVEKTFTFGAGEIRVGSTLAEPTGTIAASSAEEFFGEWKGETMVMESGTFALADMMMVMDLTINADGTLTLFDGAETDTAPWTFADGYITAADGMVELSLMENGQLCMAQEFNILYLSRAEGGEAAMNTPVATTDNVPAASAAAFVGTWVNDYYKLELYEDGTGKYFYPDGTYDDKVWVANDAGIQFTDLWWNGSTAVIDADGSLNVDNGWYVFKSENGSAAAPEASAEVPAEAMILIGEWLKPDNGNVLNINTDGTMILTYPSGTVYDMTWAIENGGVVVTTGLWEYYPMTVNEEDILEIGMFEYERVGEPYAAPVEAPGADADTEAYLGDWVEALTSISMTVNADGTVKVTYPDGGGLDMTWELIDGALEFTSGNWWGSRAVIEADGSLNIDDGWTVMTRADSSAPVETPVDTSAEGVVPVAAEAEDFAGRWIGQTMEMEGQTIALKDMGMTMEIEFGLYGNISLFDGEYTETGLWTLVDGKADIDGMVCTLMSDGTLVAEDPEGAKVIFTGFIGEWKACYLSTGGLTGDPRSMGISSTLVLNADGTGSIDFPTPENGTWYREEGILRFGENGMPMTVLPGGFLKFGSDLAGYMVFTQDESASWDPSMEVIEPAAPAEPVATAEPAQAPVSSGAIDMQARMDCKFVAKTYTAYGQTMDASMLGAEYSVLFHENGTCDFGIAGMVVPNLPWGLQKVAVGLTEVDAFVINYYGTMFNAVLTDSGFDMDYYGTMTLHFEAAE